MPGEDEKGLTRKSVDVARTSASAVSLLVDVGVAPGFLATVSLLWDAVARGSRRWQERKAAEYLQLVVEALGEGESRKLAEALDPEGVGDVWATVRVGFDTMMSTVHEDAKLCVAAVVADYLERQIHPDREYRLAGGLLAQGDRKFLDSLSILANLLPKAGTEVQRGERGVFLGGGNREKELWWCIGDEGERFGSSPPVPEPENRRALVSCLERFEYLETWTSSLSVRPPGGRQERGTGLALVRPALLGRWARLRLYLSPLSPVDTGSEIGIR